MAFPALDALREGFGGVSRRRRDWRAHPSKRLAPVWNVSRLLGGQPISWCRWRVSFTGLARLETVPTSDPNRAH